jgi:hypothetical protein
LSWSSSESATPIATAAATGRSSVATKVVIIAAREIRLVLSTVLTRLKRSELYAAYTSTAASVGMATTPTTWDRRSRMTSIHNPL